MQHAFHVKQQCTKMNPGKPCARNVNHPWRPPLQELRVASLIMVCQFKTPTKLTKRWLFIRTGVNVFEESGRFYDSRWNTSWRAETTDLKIAWIKIEWANFEARMFVSWDFRTVFLPTSFKTFLQVDNETSYGYNDVAWQERQMATNFFRDITLHFPIIISNCGERF